MPSIQDRLMTDVMALTANGGRNVGTAGHDLARDYIATRLTIRTSTTRSRCPWTANRNLHLY